MNAQGEDVVAGIRTPENIDKLKEINPKCYEQFVETTQLLEKHYKDMQDIEFTIEEGRLFFLQTRNGKRVAWFGVGGPVLEQIDAAALKTIGYARYALPILLVYLAVETFRAEENRLPVVVKIAAVLEIIWLSGVFGLLKTTSHPESGGFIGDASNRAMLSMVDPAIAAIIYVVLLFITVLFITQTSPFTVFSYSDRKSVV